MALKMDRSVDAVDITFFVNEAAERGKVVVVSNAGSGVAMDAPENVATVAATPSGNRPLGVLMNDFVIQDLTQTTLNWMKDVSPSGSKATIMTKGWCVTDQVDGSPLAGQIAVLSNSGHVSGVVIGTPLSSVNGYVGRFRSRKNEAGFAKLYVDL